MKLVQVSPNINWKSVESSLPEDKILDWVVPSYEYDSLKRRNPTQEYSFRLNLLYAKPYIYDEKSRWAHVFRDWGAIDLLLHDWNYKGTILVTETIYGKNTGVLATYQGDGSFISEDGDHWKLNELISWES